MIEVGKRYEIINSRAGNDGKIVTVLGYAGPPGFNNNNRIHGNQYQVDCTLTYNTGRQDNLIGEKLLKPIDDDDSRKVVSWEELKPIWAPSRETA